MKFTWSQLKKPFTALAPMEDVTDSVFRQIVASVSKPDIMFTEFVSVEGLCSEGRARLLPKLAYVSQERPLIAQLWGVTPKHFYTVAGEVADMGFDGIDINMGCPQKNIMKTGGGAALIDNPELAGAIIRATREGIRHAKSTIPLSVKTRIGNKRRITEEWIRFLLTLRLDALTIHGRIAKDQSFVPADWNEIQKASILRSELGVPTVLIGNGDVTSYAQAVRYARIYHMDGIMIGRGILRNILCFNPDGISFPKEQLLDILGKHISLFETAYGSQSPKFVMMKKFFKLYIRDFDGSRGLRDALMESQNPSEALKILKPMRGIEAKIGVAVSQKVKM